MASLISSSYCTLEGDSQNWRMEININIVLIPIREFCESQYCYLSLSSRLYAKFLKFLIVCVIPISTNIGYCVHLQHSSIKYNHSFSILLKLCLPGVNIITVLWAYINSWFFYRQNCSFSYKVTQYWNYGC